MPNVKKKFSVPLKTNNSQAICTEYKTHKETERFKIYISGITYSWSSGIVFMAYRMPRAENENKKTNVSISSEASCRIQRKAAKTRHLSVNVISPSAVAAAIM